MRFGIQQDAFLQALGYMLRGFPIFHFSGKLPNVATTYNFPRKSHAAPRKVAVAARSRDFPLTRTILHTC